MQGVLGYMPHAGPAVHTDGQIWIGALTWTTPGPLLCCCPASLLFGLTLLLEEFLDTGG